VHVASWMINGLVVMSRREVAKFVGLMAAKNQILYLDKSFVYLCMDMKAFIYTLSRKRNCDRNQDMDC